MIDALWSVQFGVPSAKTFGTGIAVFKDGKIYGGDSMYYYIGNYELNEGIIRATLKIKHYFGPKDNVLGPGITETELNLKGSYTDESKFIVSDGNFMAALIREEELL